MKKLLMLLSACGVFASCAPNTPQARIERDPARFAALPASEKALVERGEIKRGMSRDGVALSWGAPSGVFAGSRDGKSTERWDYFGSRPVHTTYFYGGYGRYGWHGRYHPYASYGFGLGPEISYIPYRRATVWFVRDKVDSWETAR